MKLKKRISITVLLVFLLFFAYELYRGAYSLTTTNYTVASDKITTPLRIVQLTDLHNSEFGTNNNRLVSAVNAQQPDLILITGDLLNASEETTDIAVALVQQLADLAPVYISYGNHEKEYEANYKVDLTSLFESAGAKVLEYSYEDIEINNQPLRLGGLYGYCIPAVYLKTKEADPEECAYLAEFQDTDSYTILLCHMPYCWIENNGVEEWNINCVFTGHIHGGQIRFPFIGGLYAPDQGWFPGKVAGLYPSADGDKVMVLSRGLGNTEKIPRFNNVPEVVVVDLVPK